MISTKIISSGHDSGKINLKYINTMSSTHNLTKYRKIYVPFTSTKCYKFGNIFKNSLLLKIMEFKKKKKPRIEFEPHPHASKMLSLVLTINPNPVGLGA